MVVGGVPFHRGTAPLAPGHAVRVLAVTPLGALPGPQAPCHVVPMGIRLVWAVQTGTTSVGSCGD